MNELSIQTTMSSREIAELTGKEHRNVLADCDKLNESYRNLRLAEISAGVYFHPNTGNQQHREYLLTRMQTFDLMTGYNIELRIKVNRRWEELETKEKSGGFQLPKSFSEALMLAAKQAEELENKNRMIEEQKPKVLFADAIVASENSILIGKLANVLKQNGVNIGQNRLFAWMRERGYLCKHGERYNQPTQMAMELGIFEVSYNTVVRADKSFQTITTKVTGKGQVYFVDKFLGKERAA